MDRPKFYSGEIWRSYDVGHISRHAMKGLSRAVEFVLGGTTGCLSGDGFAGTAQTVPNMTINIGPGQIAQLSEVDAATMGSLDADEEVVLQLGYSDLQVMSFNISGLTGTQQKWALVQGQFRQLDVIPSDDPDAGVPPFFDTTNPPVPLEGPDGEGGELTTVRLGAAVLDVVYGAAASAGTAVPPTPSTGWLPLYLILISNNQTAIADGDIQLAGPSAYSGYQHAPFVAGLLNSHHGGTPGQAPKVNLLTEVQNILPYPNLPVVNHTPLGVGGSVVASPGIPVCYQGAVNPNGNVAGKVGEQYLQLGGQNLKFECSLDGPASGVGQAVWTQIGFAGGIVDVTSFVTAFSPTPGNNTYLLHTTGTVNPQVQLLLTADMLATKCYFKNVGDVEVTIIPGSGQKIEGLANNATTILPPNDEIVFAPSTAVNYIVSG